MKIGNKLIKIVGKKRIKWIDKKIAGNNEKKKIKN